MLSIWGLVSLVVAVILFAVYYFKCVKEISAIRSEIEKFLAWLDTNRDFQDIDAELKKYNRLLPVWKNFEKSLTKTSDVAYSTSAATDFFSTQNLTQGMNMTFWQAYGGIFTGLGILGTFAGLTYGLSGVDMTSGDIEVLKDGIKNLLSGVESAFVTSLVGIFCAIIYSVLHHWLLKDFQGNVKSLTEKLDEVFPRRSAEDWLSKSCKIADDQTNSIKEIGETVTQAIYEGLDEKLGEAVEKLDPLVEKICEAIENLGAGGSEKIGEIFAEGVGAQMDRFSGALDRFSDGIDDKLKTANEISKIMNEQLLNTLKELDKNLKQQAKATVAERDAASAEFLSTIKRLTNTLNEVGEKIKAQQEDSVKGFSDLLKGTLDNFNATMTQILEGAQNKSEGMNQKFLENLEILTNTLNNLAEKIKTQQQESADSFAQMLKASLDNFNAVMSQILAQVQANTDKATVQTQATNEQFLSTLAGLSKTLQEVVDKVAENQTGTLGNFESLVNKLLADFDKFSIKQQEFLRNATNANSVRISEAVNAFNEIVNRHNETMRNTFEDIKELLEETEIYLESMSEASTALKQVAEPVKQSTLQLTRNLDSVSTQMNNLANANQVTRQNLDTLTAQLRAFANNFNGIANELERSTKIINDSLGNYNYKMSDGLRDALTKFDKSMNDSVGHLQGLVEGLTDALEDLRKIRR